MVKSSFELRQSARSLCALNSIDGASQWLLANSSVREDGIVCALQPQGHELKAAGTWKLPLKGCMELCSGPDPALAAALHLHGAAEQRLHIWHLKSSSDAAESVQVSGEVGSQSSIAWGGDADSRLLSCSAEAVNAWALTGSHVQVRAGALPFGRLPLRRRALARGAAHLASNGPRWPVAGTAAELSAQLPVQGCMPSNVNALPTTLHDCASLHGP